MISETNINLCHLKSNRPNFWLYNSKALIIFIESLKIFLSVETDYSKHISTYVALFEEDHGSFDLLRYH